MTERDDAWDAVHAALPAGWQVGPVTFSPAIPGYSVSAWWSREDIGRGLNESELEGVVRRFR